jgi:large subunit ribosomal protein L35e
MQSSTKIKPAQLWPKKKEELTKQLVDLKKDLSQLRIQKITSSGTKLNKMCVAWPFGGRLGGRC